MCRVVRCAGSFGCSSVIAWPAVLTSCSNLADFSRLRKAEAANCEGLVTECEVRDELKQVDLNKLPGLDSLPYEEYLRMSHMFVHIVMGVFNHWFAQGAIPGSITKDVITLLKKGGRHVCENLDDYRPINLLKILARVLANRLQLVISDLIRQEQNYAVKGRSIQDNLRLVREVLEGLKDDTKAALINLDQSKVFDRVDNWFGLRFWRPPDSNRSSANGSACCASSRRRWFRWMWSVWKRLSLSGRSGRVAPCRLFSMYSLWSPCFEGLGMGWQICLCMESFLLAVSERRSLRTPMISLSLCPADRT